MKRFAKYVMLGLALLGCAESSTASKNLSETVAIEHQGITDRISSFDYDPRTNTIYYMLTSIDNPDALYKYDLNTKQTTELMQFDFGVETKTFEWVNVTQSGSVLVYDLGKYDLFDRTLINPAQIHELENDMVIRSIPVIDARQLDQQLTNFAPACQQLLENSAMRTPLGYLDIHAGTPSMRQKPIELGARFILIEKDGETVALDSYLCGNALFAQYLSDIDAGNIGTFNKAVLDKPTGKEWLRMNAENLTFTSKKVGFLVNFECEKYEGELVWGDYKIISGRCATGILDFPTSMNLFVDEKNMVYRRLRGIFIASKQ